MDSLQNKNNIRNKIEYLLDLTSKYCSEFSIHDKKNIIDVALNQLSEESDLSYVLQVLVKTCTDLTSEEYHYYQYIASICANWKLRYDTFQVINSNDIPHIKEIIKKNVSNHFYTNDLLLYTDDELNILNDFINHDRDYNLTYAAFFQFQHKYLIKNKITSQYVETPQICFLLIGMILFYKYSKLERLHFIKELYDQLSLFHISLPTPILAGVRSTQKQFSSCVLVDIDDSLDSIVAGVANSIFYTAQKAGLGINLGRIRSIGSSIRNNTVIHTGCTPYYKLFQYAIKSCHQGSVRPGSATVFYPIWHSEVMTLLQLKNNRGTEENRVRHLDYGVQINGLFYKRLKEGKEITLFSPHQVTEMYEAYFANNKKFEELYEEAEKNPLLNKIKINAVELFSTLLLERAQTGRIYIQNVDHCNDHSSFNHLAPSIKGSNLCMEITLPTSPLSYKNPSEGEIALCTLGAINLKAINSLEDIQPLAKILVRTLNEVIEYQDYLTPAQKGIERKSLGIGVNNFAYFLANHSLKYSDGSANTITHQLFEAIQYYLIQASCELAKEKGRCTLFHQTKYGDGLLPIDHYYKSIDKLIDVPLQQDWESLRQEIAQYGLANSTLSAIMPCEVSSIIINATNGIEPLRSPITLKGSINGTYKHIAPLINHLKDKYQYIWKDIPNNKGYLQLVAIMQKFCDQSISANLYYNPLNYHTNKIPIQELMSDMLTAYSYGIKTLYYHITLDQLTISESQSATSLSLSEEKKEECIVCKL
jgi:ribonucleoside-diphosphate reductase alpha chain